MKTIPKDLKPYYSEDEEIVLVTLPLTDSKGEEYTETFYAIKDTFLGMWRSDQTLDSYDAWTKCPFQRPRYDTREDGEDALIEMLRERMELSESKLEHAT